jgi:tetratricopeptide (TPR) repeat protein
MENKSNKTPDWLPPVLIGFVVGIVLACLGINSMFNSRPAVIAAIQKASQTVTPLIPTPTVTLLVVPTATVTPEPTQPPDLDAVLEIATEMLYSGKIQEARDSLLPLLSIYTQLKDLERINLLIGDTYTFAGESKMASSYYGDAYSDYPGAENLFKLASSHSIAGDLTEALTQFEALEKMTGEQADPYQEAAQVQLNWLRQYFGTTTPVPNNE